MKTLQHSLRLIRTVPAVALLLASACSDDETRLQLDPPGQLKATPSATALLIEWQAVDHATAYELQAANDADYTFTTTVETSRYELTGLKPYTEYEVCVRALVASGGYTDSEWSARSRFRTLDLTVAEQFDGGDGTAENPYLISRPSHLALLAQAVNEGNAAYAAPGVHYALTADLDLSAYEAWSPIGTGNTEGRYPYENPAGAFQGSFDGQGHTITNLRVDYTGTDGFTAAGLFGINDGSIRNLHVEGSVAATTSATGKSYVAAGGIAGFNIIAYDENGVDPRPLSGSIEQCSFRGSVSASCGSDLLGEADAGGIVGIAESGNIDNCRVTLDEGERIGSTGGSISMTGGIAGSMNGGRITSGTCTGSGTLECLFNASPTGYAYAQAGGIVGSTGDASVEQCHTDFKGAIRIPDAGAAICNMGLICGNAGAPISACSAHFAGEASIRSGSTINFGTVAGSLAGVGQTAIAQTTAQLAGSLTIEQTDAYSDVNVGGIHGTASGATVSACDATISGTITVTSQVTDPTTHVNIGGIAGTSGLLTAGCRADWLESAQVQVRSDRTNFGGVAGLTQSADNYAGMIGCHAICNGRVEIAPNSGTDYTPHAGGIAGTFSGYSMIWPVVMEIPAYMEGCYALVDTDFAITGGTARGVVGNTEAATFTGVFYSSEQGGITEEAEGCHPFASLDRTGFEKAIAQMNAAISGSIFSLLVQAGYTYDAEQGIPVLTGSR